MGFCANSSSSSSGNRFFGRSWSGYGKTGESGSFGRRRGWRCQFWATGLPGWIKEGYGYPVYEAGFGAREEITILQNQADVLKRQLEEIQSRIDMLERGKKQEGE
jgi:hypothetical protein